MNNFRFLGAIFGAFFLYVPSISFADDPVHFVSAIKPASLPDEKRTTLGLYLTAVETGEFLSVRKDALLIDIRTRAEVSFVGIAEEADKNIPYMVMDEFWDFDDEKGTYKMTVNSNFTTEVNDLVREKGLSKEGTIILMCRSGSRSARAANLLAQLGYSNVYSVVDGFEGDKDPQGARTVNGWKNAHLTWSYKIRGDQAY
ncbi:sulfurtransferase [Ruegeria pomeroyi]|uniref:Sulfurtransferase n=1 Tax=Ruegeria pomeroyi TaxID=89184 RepID=A0A9Q3ZME0_9RHOB|nr:rhodanese-like domain-containing protein [Ruegeria pomeroyi]MCE8512308.1 sulfurtransferase [Ruegeria pomeroyi]MCE8537975.1 sulfurtransferase [Ruegeria pomeroyi]MCE8556299.1 sulfurtransferase [Ruegeria pomeroyi]